MTPQEYNDCVDLYADSLYRFTVKNNIDPKLSQEIVRHGFEKIWEKRKSVHYETARITLFKTIYLEILEHFKKDKKIIRTEESDDPQLKVVIFSKDLNEVLNFSISRLTPTQRCVLLLRDYEGYNYEEISKITNLTTEQAKIYLFKARKFLKNYLAKMEVAV